MKKIYIPWTKWNVCVNKRSNFTINIVTNFCPHTEWRVCINYFHVSFIWVFFFVLGVSFFWYFMNISFYCNNLSFCGRFFCVRDRLWVWMVLKLNRFYESKTCVYTISVKYIEKSHSQRSKEKNIFKKKNQSVSNPRSLNGFKLVQQQHNFRAIIWITNDL